MRYLLFLLCSFLLPSISQAQFTPSESGLTILVTDGTQQGRKSVQQAPGSVLLPDPIRPLGMTDAIQAAAFLERPDFGLMGFILVFCVNDSIDGRQGDLEINGEVYKGVYRLIRQKIAVDEVIPVGMTTFRLSGTVFFLGIS
ncbi:MAG: hypothetical protein AAF990_13795 [Bacteroidota bacterium]